VLIKLGPKHSERYGLSWLEAAKKRLHDNVLANKLGHRLGIGSRELKDCGCRGNRRLGPISDISRSLQGRATTRKSRVQQNGFAQQDWLHRLTHWLFFCGHFRASIHQGGTMTDVTIPGGKIRAFVERIENLDIELQELNEQKKEGFAEAKGEGFDVKVLKEIIKLRKQDQEERDERESLLDLYMRAMEQAEPEKVARAAGKVWRVSDSIIRRTACD
jgi:uncharacterized protein (UPF0335 family)